MNTTLIIFLYWLIASIFGNHFIKFSIVGINTFYILMGLGILYCFLRPKGIKTTLTVSIESKRMYNSFKYYSIISLIYIFLSFFNSFTYLFDIDVEFKFSYIFRQGYLVFTIPIILTIVNSIVKNPDYWIRKITNRKVLIFSLFLIVLSKYTIGVDTIPSRSFVFAIISMIVILHPKKISSWLIMIFSSFTLLSFDLYSSSIIAFVLAMFICVFWNFVKKIINKNINWKIWAILVASLVLVILFTDSFINLFSDDASTMWRWQYWMNEIQVLFDTKFLGAGYGTAYASNSIFSEINNTSVFFSSAEGAEGIFVITQHNSYMNFLYRLGIIGFIISLQTWFINPLKLISEINKYENRYSILVKWGFVNFIFNTIIILTNPGLESPRFAIGFLIPFAMYIAFCILAHKENLINEK